MFRTPELLEETRAQIAVALGPVLEGLASMALLEGYPALGESIPILLLTEDSIGIDDGGLRDRVEYSGRWHHQIYDGEAVRTYACSEPPPGGVEPTEIAEIAQSSLPAAIRAAMAWIDETIQGEGEARLVTVPSHQVTALWLEGPKIDHVVVVSAPQQFEEFQLTRPLEQSEFLSALARMPAIQGVGLSRDIEGESE